MVGNSQCRENLPRNPNTGASKERRLKIAIVEDDPLLCNLYSTILTTMGIQIPIIAQNAEQMINAIGEGQTKNLDLAIVDYRLGKGINGLDLARMIAQDNEQIEIMIATADDSISEEVREAGFTLLLKPFSVRDLREFISEQLGRKSHTISKINL
jgi:DNA-binding response OmpR family regulator